MKPADKKFKTIEYDLETDFEKIRTVERIVDIIYRDYIERAEEVDKVLRLGNENPTGYTRADIQNLSIVRAEEEFEKGKRQFYKLPEHKRRELIYRYKNYYERQKKKKEKSLATAEKNKTKKRNVDVVVKEPSCEEDYLRYHFNCIVVSQSSFSKEKEKLIYKPITVMGKDYTLEEVKNKYYFSEYGSDNKKAILYDLLAEMKHELSQYKNAFVSDKPIVLAEFKKTPSIIAYKIDEKFKCNINQSKSETEEAPKSTKANEAISKKIKRIIMRRGKDHFIFEITANKKRMIIFLDTSYEDFQICSSFMCDIFNFKVPGKMKLR